MGEKGEKTWRKDVRVWGGRVGVKEGWMERGGGGEE